MIENNRKKFRKLIPLLLATILVAIGLLTFSNKMFFLKANISSNSKYTSSQKVFYPPEESKFVNKISNSKAKKTLKSLMNYKLKPGEKFDKDQNIISTIQTKNGPKTITFLGYNAMKTEYLVSKNTASWEELSIKKIPSTAPKTLSMDNPLMVSNDPYWVPEKPNTEVGTKAQDSICAKRAFEKGALEVDEVLTADSLCLGLYKGIPISFRTITSAKPWDLYLHGEILTVNSKPNVFQGSKVWDCYKEKSKNHAAFITSLDEAKKCIDGNLPGYEQMYGYGTEICDNNMDDDSNGKTDCADQACANYVVLDNQSRDAICLKNDRQFCSSGENKFGTVKNAGGFEVLCYDNKPYKSWAECDTDNVQERKGDHGVTKKLGDVVSSGSCSYVCSKVYDAERWVGCGCNTEPDGIKAKEGQTYSGLICNKYQWTKPSQYDDTLKSINPTLSSKGYSTQGLMYWGKELYDQGVFPLLPKLTPVKDQGQRGTCGSFAETAAIEIILPDHLDLSEQNNAYHNNVFDLPMGLEKEWPYNKEECLGKYENTGAIGSYSTPFGTFACSDLHGQPIPLGDGTFGPPTAITKTQSGGCFSFTDVLMKSDGSYSIDMPWVEYVLNTLHYPLTYSLMVDQSGIGKDGFLKKEFFGNDTTKGHVVLVIAFIPKDKIPQDVKANPDFMPNEDYLIIKNSWGTGSGDGGFLYAPGSLFSKNLFTLLAWKYDPTAKNCPDMT